MGASGGRLVLVWVLVSLGGVRVGHSEPRRKRVTTRPQVVVCAAVRGWMGELLVQMKRQDFAVCKCGRQKQAMQDWTRQGSGVVSS